MPRSRSVTAFVLFLLGPAGLLAQGGYLSRFAPDGTYLSSAPLGLAGDQSVSFLARDAGDRIYVGREDRHHASDASNPNDVIAVFAPDGSFLRTLKGGTRMQQGLTFDASGDLYFGAVPEGGSLSDRRVYHFDPAGNEIAAFGPALNDYMDFVTAPGDRIFALRDYAREILEFTTAGTEVNAISSSETFGRYLALAADGGSLWSYEPQNLPAPRHDGLVHYDLALDHISVIDLLPYGNPPVVGLEIDAAGELLVLLEDARVLVFAGNGALLREMRLEPLSEAQGFVLTSDGTLAAAHVGAVTVAAIPTLDRAGLALLALALAALAAYRLARRRSAGAA